MAVRKARLGWLLDDGEFLVELHDGPNRRAAAESVEWLVTHGLPAEGLDSLVEGFVMLAEAVDADPTNARLWAEYRSADLHLRQVAKEAANAESDAEADWSAPVTVIRPTPVRDAQKPRSGNTRRGGGRGLTAAPEAADAVAAPRRRRSAGD